MLNSLGYTLPDDLLKRLDEVFVDATVKKLVDRIWQKDASVWTGNDEANWLGWLDIIEHEIGQTESYKTLQTDIASAGFRDILLMGMGGSSLCPEVLALTFGKTNFHILDSTVPAQVKAVENRLDLEKTLFIVASKSGSTLEPNCFKQYFFELLAERVGRENAGRQFIAITDPGSKMEQVARNDGFRHIVYGKPEIGGRFSALSAFGMTAAAAMGIDTAQFLSNAKVMSNECREAEAAANPGAVLGAIVGVCHAAGRDKLTIFVSKAIHDLGAWLEQLVAESTGKNGVAIIPVDRESFTSVEDYGDDRIFAFVSVGDDTEYLDTAFALTKAGHPVIKIGMETVDSLGQEFFRWEFATAVAGSLMKIDPFDQPDVEAAKIEAKKITEAYEASGSLPPEEPFLVDGDLSFFAGKEFAAQLLSNGSTAADVINTHIKTLSDGDYFALLGYIQMTDSNDKLLQALRNTLRQNHNNATCLGFGPRFLHSTGQAYKGGPNTGVFLQITADDAEDLAVPGQKYTFGVVKAAQARGDFQVLVDRGRRALRVHISTDIEAGLKRLDGMF